MYSLQILKTLENVAEVVATRNKAIKPGTINTRAKLSTMSIEHQLRLATTLSEYMEIIREPGVEKSTPRDIDLLHLRKFLQRKGLFIKDSNYEDFILDGDLIEVYDATGAQLFRNIEYFNYSTYTVWEVATESWENLYYRPSTITHIMLQEWAKLFGSSGETPFKINVPKHILKEIGGRQGLCEIEFKWGWPLFDKEGQIAGALMTERARNLPPADDNQIKFI
jgi:hypothetical protein